MNILALNNLSYGVFVLGTNNEENLNACIINTSIQVTVNPVQFIVTSINENKTCEMLKKSKTFALSVLDKTCTFDTIRHFGYQSGRKVDKFANFPYSLDVNGNPYLKSQVCSVISGKITSSIDLGTHTLFIADVQDAIITSDNPPLTYADYQNEIKPKQTLNPEKKIVGWRCKICGFEIMEKDLSKDFICPVCGHTFEDFEPIYE